MVQLSHPYVTTGKTIALTKQTFVGKVMSLLFNTLSRSAIAFLPRSKHLLISFKIDWFDLLTGQGTFKSLYQHHSLKASVLLCSAIFMIQLSHPYMTTGKIIAVTLRTFVGKIMFLLFNMLSNGDAITKNAGEKQ